MMKTVENLIESASLYSFDDKLNALAVGSLIRIANQRAEIVLRSTQK
jgi:hypothetical protein